MRSQGPGLICLVYPLISPSAVTFKVVLLLLWGVSVGADPPQFLTMSSQAAPSALPGPALELQNEIGFLISAISIVLLSKAMPYWGEGASRSLVPWPLLGLWAMHSLLRSDTVGSASDAGASEPLFMLEPSLCMSSLDVGHYFVPSATLPIGTVRAGVDRRALIRPWPRRRLS
ncbi:hypothetical protein DBV39_15170 [Orrella marina]|uniref:Uncharacterized protein n=1 Tax=Orrella marina TaxID=2163011 RepID=A0A2R4XM26_9BURK|nr:hypothetical protein DBV39_15170 [Orrella marina]